MSKFNRHNSTKSEPSYFNRPIHPIWRGVGCGLIVLIPLISYFLAEAFLLENQKRGWVVFPSEWILANVPDPLIINKIATTIAFALILYAILTLVTFITFRLFAPSRYGPLDVPPDSYRGGSYKR